MRDRSQGWASVWVQAPFLRGPQGAERLRQWLPQHREIRARCAARRERVLRHEWARARLCRLLGIADAGMWNGYVPPALDQRGQPDTGNAVRRELVALLKDVEKAEAGG
ncbi:MAG: hypothetical protein M3N52_11965 [Actinomycetota bacterium]|nr:hypothetical protein [Actinomycetota bacterium]